MAPADLVHKALVAGLGAVTIYLTGTFSFNVYRGIAWHNAQPKLETEQLADQSQ